MKSFNCYIEKNMIQFFLGDSNKTVCWCCFVQHEMRHSAEMNWRLSPVTSTRLNTPTNEVMLLLKRVEIFQLVSPSSSQGSICMKLLWPRSRRSCDVLACRSNATFVRMHKSVLADRTMDTISANLTTHDSDGIRLNCGWLVQDGITLVVSFCKIWFYSLKHHHALQLGTYWMCSPHISRSKGWAL